MSNSANNITNLSQTERRALLSQILQEKAQKSNLAFQIKCIHQLFEAQVEQTPDTVAIVFEDQQLSYRELNSRANQLAHYLRSLGMGPEVLIGICMERSVELVVALLGILKAGSAYVPLDPAYPRHYLALIVEDSQPSLLLSQQRLMGRLPEHKTEVICLDSDWGAIASHSQENPISGATPENLAYVLYASSRGVLVEHRGVAHRLDWLQNTFTLSESDVMLHQASLAQERAVLEIFGPLVVGGRLVIAAASLDYLTYLQQLIITQKVSFVYFLPSVLSAFIESLSPDLANHLSSLRLVFCSGEPLRQSVVEAFFRHFTGKLHNLYSQPEAVGEVTSQACLPVSSKDVLPVGYPTYRSVYVLDQRLHPVPVGVKGEIYVGGTDLARGYLQAPAQTARCFIKNPFSEAPDTRLFKTGDIGRHLNDGTLELVGSVNRQVWIQGFLVELEEVEAALLTSASVVDCRVLVRETETALFLVAYVVLSGSLVLEQLQSHIQALLPAHMLPSAYVPLATLPLTATGQVDQQALTNLEVIDSDLVHRWEEQLQSLPEIEQVAVVVQELTESLPPLHLSDLLPNWNVAVNKSISPIEPLIDPEVIQEDRGSNKRPAISCGESLRQEVGAPTTLAAALQRAALERTKGIVYIQSDGSQSIQSYEDLLAEAQRILAGLRKLGLKPQDKVIFQLDLNQDFIPAFWSCILGGFVPVPIAIAPTYEESNGTVNKLHHVWQMLERPIVLTSLRLASAIRSLSNLLPFEDFCVETVDELRSYEPDQNWHLGHSEDLALLMLTSGSTGMPKAVMLSTHNILSRTLGSIQTNNFSSQDVTLNWMSLEHVAGLIYFHIRDVYLGCQQIHAATEVVLQNPLKWLDWIERFRVTITFAPNFAFGIVNNQAEAIGKRHWDLSSIRFILNGAEAISARIARRFLELLVFHKLPITAMHPAWGMAETSSGVTYSNSFSLDSTTDDISFVELGPPIPGISLRIVDEHEQLVTEGKIGHLQVKGASVTLGYYQNPEASREAFTDDGWFKTGDLGLLQNGRLTITGREKNLIIINGINYSSHEIEAAVEEVAGVEVSYTAACAVRVPGSNTDNLAIFFSSKLSDDINLVALIQEIRAKVVKNIKVNPDYFIPVEKEIIPKTAIGKIQRLQLGKRFESGEFDHILKRLDLLTESSNTIPDWFYRTVWCPKEAMPNAFSPQTGGALVFLDQLGLGTFLCGQLEQQNLSHVSIEIGSDFSQLSPNRYRIAANNPDHYQQLLESLAANKIEINQILHLWTYDNYAGEISSLSALEHAQEQGIYSLLFLVQALGKVQSSKHSIRLLFISSHTQCVSPTDDIAYEKSSVLGMIKTIPQEMPWLTSCHIDLSIDRVEVNGARILQELRVLSAEREIAYRNGKRFVSRLEKVDLPQEPMQKLPFQQSGMYLITGGLGGIGVQIAKYLLEHYKARLLLVGRTPLPERSTWQVHLEHTNAISQRIQAYQMLEQLEGEVIYEAVDVCDLPRLQQVVAEGKCRWGGNLDGVIHLAGIPQERMLVEETQESLVSVLRPKILGTWVLHQLLQEQKQGLFINFSSVNGFFGGTAVGAYASANSFLDGFAHYQKYQSPLQTYCFAWSMWDEIGVSKGYQMKELTRARGYYTMTALQGLHSLLGGLHHNQTQLLIGLDGSNQNLRRYMKTKSHRTRRLTGFFTTTNNSSSVLGLPELRVRDRFGTKSTCDFVQLEEMPLTDTGQIAPEQLVKGAPSLASKEWVMPQNEVERLIANIWQEVLRVPQVGIHDNFFELGGDSILSIQVITRANQAGLQLSAKQLFQQQTIAELAAVAGRKLTQKAAQGLVLGPVPLTPIQHWFFEQNLPEAHHFNQSMLLEVPPDLKPSLLGQVVEQLLVHHDALRLRFTPSESGWQQVNVGPEETRNFRVVELWGMASDEQIAQMQSMAAAVQTSLNLQQGPLMRAVLFDLGRSQPGRLLLSVHHLVVDGVSWRILLEDMTTAYEQLALGQSVQLPAKTTAFQEWAEQLRAYGQSVAVARELDYWLGQFQPRVVSLPVDYECAKAAQTVACAGQVSVSLSEAQTRALLQEVPKAYNTQINDVLLTALVQSFGQWTGESTLLVDLEGHGREELFEQVDVSRTVGWLTTLFPVRLALTAGEHPGTSLKSVKEQLRRLPNRGMGYGILRYLSREEATRQQLQAQPAAQVSFNYLGQFDQMLKGSSGWRLAKESTGPVHSPKGRRTHLLSVNGLIAADRLQMDWTYSENVHHRATVERLAAGFIQALQALIAHCQSPEAGGYTPSDFSEAELSQEELDELVANID